MTWDAASLTDAWAVLATHWDGEYPINPVPIARALGASVFLARLEEGEYGRLDSDSAGPNIYVEREQPEVRRVWTCAHEIGHLYFQRHEPDPFHSCSRDAGDRDAEERYAEAFAAGLLMPQRQVKILVHAGASAAEMASFFGVPLLALGQHLKRLEIEA